MLFGSLNNFLRVHRGSWNQKLENYPSINLRSPGVAFPKHHQFFGGLLIRLTTENLLTNNLVSHTHHLYSPTKTLTYKPVSPGIFITWGGGWGTPKRNLHRTTIYNTKYNMNKSEATLVKVRVVFSATSSSIPLATWRPPKVLLRITQNAAFKPFICNCLNLLLTQVSERFCQFQNGLFSTSPSEVRWMVFASI